MSKYVVENKQGINDWYPTYGIEIPSLGFKSFLSPAGTRRSHYALMNLLRIPEKKFENRAEVFEIMEKWGKLQQGNPRASLQNVSAPDLQDAENRTQHLKGSAAQLSLEDFCELEQMDCWDEEEPVVLMLEGLHGMTEVGIVCINCE